MIDNFYTRGKNIQLFDREVLIPEKNIFTILVGKNGTGKSTLLGSLTDQITREISKNRKNLNEGHLLSTIYNDHYFNDGLPSKVIAVSTSPFDKFPIDRFKKLSNYTYLGLRDVNSTSIGLGYLSKIIASLIESISNDQKQAIEIFNVLEFLEFRDEINIALEYTLTEKQINDFLTTKNITEEFDNRSNLIFRRINRQFFTNLDDSLNERKFSKLYKSIQDLHSNDWYNHRTELNISRYGFENHKEHIENIIFLFNAGFIRLRDVKLIKIKDNERYSIKEASSGEQSIILSILGIASKIKDNCLILIDEPEICLHPHWQETYIDILTQTFDKYKYCQFIIATHSPLMISRLSSYNSFITDMETQKLSNAEQFVNNSVDFQLANVFNHPGFKNEYLLRIAMNIFSNISKNKKFGKNDIESYEILEEQSKYLRGNDPVLDLYRTIVELKKIYE